MELMRMVASLSARAYSGGGAGGPDEPDEPDDGPQCFYKVLGVDETATEAEVKKAYRNLALKHHPDVKTQGTRSGSEGDGGADVDDPGKQFVRIAEAYEVLSDERKRAYYDFSRRQARAQPRYGDPSQGPRGGPSGDGFYDRYTDDFKRRRRSPFEEWKAKQDRWQQDYQRKQRAKEAWEEEKREAEANKVRARTRMDRAEEAHRVRVGKTLKRFWHTSPKVTKYDVAFVSAMAGCMGCCLVSVSWL